VIAGIGWRHAHERALLDALPDLPFIEVHSENFFGDGGASLALLERAREHYPVSLHGVGLALGSAAGLDADHLERLAALVERMEPVRVSDHACFARAPRQPGAQPSHACDLLPLAFTPGALDLLAANVQRVQDRLRRPIGVENLSSYLGWADDTLAEADFLARLARRTGCWLLLDVNNLIVNALNARAADPVAQAGAFVDALDTTSVGEIHLAGYHAGTGADALVIDDHGSPVHAPVWDAYAHALATLGAKPTLIEWDTALPAFDVLLAQAREADRIAARSVQPVAAGRAPAAVTAPPASQDTAPEHARQIAFMRALWRDDAPGALHAIARGPRGVDAGVAAYRANAGAIAERALASAFPTLAALVGDASFAALAQAFWHHDAPQHGDLAQWGQRLPAFVAASAALADEPYLADSARLDWLVHAASSAADAPAQPLALHRLADTDPACLRLRLAPGSALLASVHPIVAVWRAHHAAQPDDADRFDDVRRAFATARAETAFVWRDGLRVRVEPLDAAGARFVRALLSGLSLAAALDAAGPESFAFDRWLAHALQTHALVAIDAYTRAA
jgi:uncharacterized protein (UPF0276 family)